MLTTILMLTMRFSIRPSALRGLSRALPLLSLSACAERKHPVAPPVVGDLVAGSVYVARVLNGAPLPAAVEWQARDGSCIPGSAAGASFTFLPNGGFEFRVQRGSDTTSAIMIGSYAQPDPGVVTASSFVVPATARHDTLWATLTTAAAFFCSSAGPTRWIAVRSR